MVAAQIMADLCVEKENRYIELYGPTRSKMKKEDITSFAKTNASVAKELVKGKTELLDLKLEDLKNGSGDLIMLDGKKVGAYKDDQGKVYLVKPACYPYGLQCFL